VHTYTYDGTGNRTTTGYATGTANELAQAPNPPGGTWTYASDAEGNATAKTLNGTGTTWLYGYDNLNRLTSAQEYTAPTGGTLQATVTYTYDVFGNRTQQDVTQSGPTVTTRFAYDGWKTHGGVQDSSDSTHWDVWADGVEETAIITLLSPAEGAHLLSGFGDIGGFAHDNLTVSPPAGMYTHPLFSNTDTLDCAGQHPLVVVRSGRADERSATLAYSEDGGHAWQPLDAPAAATQPAAGGRRRAGVNGFSVSADGGTFVVASATRSSFSICQVRRRERSQPQAIR